MISVSLELPLNTKLIHKAQTGRDPTFNKRV